MPELIAQTNMDQQSVNRLREELLAIKRGVGPTTTPANEQETDGPEGSCVEALGTMSISDRGVSRFIGRSGGGESLILVS